MYWHQLDHMQTICTSLQTDNHTDTSSLNFIHAECSSWRPTNSVKALMARALELYNLEVIDGIIMWQLCISMLLSHLHTHTHTHLTALCPGLPVWANTRKVKPIWVLLEQETVSGSGISWAVCKSAPRSRQITTTAPHQSVFYRPDALPAAQPTASKHWKLWT